MPKGTDLFISIWNLHRSPALWDQPDDFRPERFGPLDKVPNEVRLVSNPCTRAALLWIAHSWQRPACGLQHSSMAVLQI